MHRIKTAEKAVFNTAGSTADANRLYSILLDTRASSVSENMYDIAEKLMKNEKDNAKLALEQLWSLKKNLTEEPINNTVEMLINFYQEKIDILRDKEAHIKKVSKDSRELLEEKRKRDSEVAMVKQEIGECTRETERLQEKMRELKVKEQELLLIGGQVDKELKLNANEVVNGLYEIILASQNQSDERFTLDNELSKSKNEASIEEVSLGALAQEQSEVFDEMHTLEPPAEEKKQAAVFQRDKQMSDDTDLFESFATGQCKKAPVVETPVPFARSVVKTTRGVVIGEYYYNAQVPKNRRHYIYNSSFFRKNLSEVCTALNVSFNKTLYGEAVQIIQDAFKRIAEKTTLHFEVSTNEILNKNVLKELLQKMAARDFEMVLIVCNKLKAKIDALGNNYFEMLKEQMARNAES